MTKLPDEFLESISCCKGFEKDSFVEAHQIPSPTSIRINPFKKTELSFKLDKPVLWNDKGYYLEERPNFTHDILFQAGCYYVQEAGSMFIEYALKSVVDFNETLLALDLCASPGGKSTLLNSLLNNQSVLVANEIAKQRADALCQNLTKWGTSNVVVTNNDPSVFAEMEQVFDIILVDAPCSGSGLFRKQHDAVDEWSLDNVNLCSSRQKRILADIVGSLKDGGVLVYSTCSYSEQENEAIIDWLVSEFNLENSQLDMPVNCGIVESISEATQSYGYRFYPNKTQSEGFFCSILKKKKSNETNQSYRKLKHETFTTIKAKEKELFVPWLDNLDEHEVIKFKDDYLLTNTLALEFINRHPKLYLKKVGTTIGSLIKNEVIPHHDLALSIHLSKQLQTITCSDEDALSFYKKTLQNVVGSKGWNLMAYKGFGLGWVKNLGNRINNYLPNEYRILK